MEKRKRVIDIKLKLFSDDFHGCFEAGLYVNPTGNYMFKVNSRNSRTKCEICFTFTIKTPEQRHLRLFGVFIVVFEHISLLVLVFFLLPLVNARWEASLVCQCLAYHSIVDYLPHVMSKKFDKFIFRNLLLLSLAKRYDKHLSKCSFAIHFFS